MVGFIAPIEGNASHDEKRELPSLITPEPFRFKKKYFQSIFLEKYITAACNKNKPMHTLQV